MDEQSKMIDALINYVIEPFQWTLTTLVACRTMTVLGSSEAYDEEEGDLRKLINGIDYDILEEDRLPRKVEIQLCSPHIAELIQSIQPHGIVLLDTEYKSKLPTLNIKFPHKKEYKLLPLLKESHKLTKFISKLYDKF